MQTVLDLECSLIVQSECFDHSSPLSLLSSAIADPVNNSTQQQHSHTATPTTPVTTMQSAPPTASSEIVHLVTVFADTLDALPPTLTRSLSDLKELDAVLSGSLAGITAKLQLLLTMMHTPSTPSSGTAESTPAVTYTPLDRLKLLREVTEEARVFRLGGEDKIRVATSTCEAVSSLPSFLAQTLKKLNVHLPLGCPPKNHRSPLTLPISRPSPPSS